MTEVRVDRDEWWPWYYFPKDDLYGDVIDVPEDTLAGWRLVLAAAVKVQSEIAAYLDDDR